MGEKSTKQEEKVEANQPNEKVFDGAAERKNAQKIRGSWSLIKSRDLVHGKATCRPPVTSFSRPPPLDRHWAGNGDQKQIVNLKRD